MKQPQTVLNFWISSIEDDGVDLTRWEEEFVEDFKGQLRDRGTWTEAQQDKLEQIYTNKVG